MKTETITDGHIHKTPELKHLASAMMSEVDKAVEAADTDTSVGRYILQMEIERQVSQIMKLAKQVMMNPSQVYESLMAIADEITENSKHV